MSVLLTTSHFNHLQLKTQENMMNKRKKKLAECSRTSQTKQIVNNNFKCSISLLILASFKGEQN